MFKIYLAVAHKDLEDFLVSNKMLIAKKIQDEVDFVGTAVYREGIIQGIKDFHPDVIIIREGIPGSISLSDLVYQIKIISPSTRIIFIAGDRKPGDAFLATLVQYGVYDILIGQKVHVKEMIKKIIYPNKMADVIELMPKIRITETDNKQLYEAPDLGLLKPMLEDSAVTPDLKPLDDISVQEDEQEIKEEPIQEESIDIDEPEVGEEINEEVEQVVETPKKETKRPLFGRRGGVNLNLEKPEEPLVVPPVDELPPIEDLPPVVKPEIHISLEKPEIEEPVLPPVETVPVTPPVQEIPVVQPVPVVVPEVQTTPPPVQTPPVTQPPVQTPYPYGVQQNPYIQNTPPVQNMPPVQNAGIPEQNMGMPVQNTNVPMQNTGIPYQNTNIPVQNTDTQVQNNGMPDQNMGAFVQNTGMPNQNNIPVQNGGMNVPNPYEQSLFGGQPEMMFTPRVNVAQDNEQTKRSFFGKKTPSKTVAQQVVTFCGGRHGCGNSQIAFNTALYLAEQGYKTLYMDLDESFSSIDSTFAFGLSDLGIDTMLRDIAQGNYPNLINAISSAPRILNGIEKNDSAYRRFSKFPAKLEMTCFSLNRMNNHSQKVSYDINLLKELNMFLLMNMNYDIIILDAPSDLNNLATNIALIYSNRIMFTITQDASDIDSLMKNVRTMQGKKMNYREKSNVICNKYIPHAENPLSTIQTQVENFSRIQNLTIVTVPNIATDMINASVAEVPVLWKTKDKNFRKGIQNIANLILS